MKEILRKAVMLFLHQDFGVQWSEDIFKQLIKTVILTQNAELLKLATEDARLTSALASGNQYELLSLQIIRHRTTTCAGERIIHDCLVRQRG
jgi:hypothetical protein